MKKFNGVKKKEQTILDSLKQIVVFDEDANIYPVDAIFGSYERVESFVINSAEDDGFYFQVAEDAEDMRLPVIGVTTHEIGPNHVKMRGLILAAYREDLNQIIEQLYKTVDNENNIKVSNVKVNNKIVNKCSLVSGEFDIQIDD